MKSMAVLLPKYLRPRKQVILNSPHKRPPSRRNRHTNKRRRSRAKGPRARSSGPTSSSGRQHGTNRQDGTDWVDSHCLYYRNYPRPFVTKRITDPITQLSDAATAGSNGDLSIDVDDHVENDELGQMIDAFSEMQTNLRTILTTSKMLAMGLQQGSLSVISTRHTPEPTDN